MSVRYYLAEEQNRFNPYNSRYDTWGTILSFFVLWLLVYYVVCKRFKNKSPEYCIRAVTVLHGMVSSYFGLRQCFGNDGLFGKPAPMTNEQALLLAFSASYFMLDLVWCMYYQTETRLMLAHHVYSCFSLMRILFKGYSGTQSACGLGCAEVTNPLLQARWFIRSAGYHNTTLYVAVEVIFMITFFIMRIFFGTIFTFHLVFTRENNMEYRIMSIIIYIISWLFMINILKYLQNKYVERIFTEEDVKP